MATVKLTLYFVSTSRNVLDRIPQKRVLVVAIGLKRIVSEQESDILNRYKNECTWPTLSHQIYEGAATFVFKNDLNEGVKACNSGNATILENLDKVTRQG